MCANYTLGTVLHVLVPDRRVRARQWVGGKGRVKKKWGNRRVWVTTHWNSKEALPDVQVEQFLPLPWVLLPGITKQSLAPSSDTSLQMLIDTGRLAFLSSFLDLKTFSSLILSSYEKCSSPPITPLPYTGTAPGAPYVRPGLRSPKVDTTLQVQPHQSWG